MVYTEGIVIVSTLAVRNGPGLNFSSTGDVLLEGTKIRFTEFITEYNRTWGLFEKGWVQVNNNGKYYIKLETDNPIVYKNAVTVDTTKGVTKSASSSLTTTTQYTSEMLKKSMRLFGLPYQFPDTVDHRYPGISKKVGRKFLDNIILPAPVITIIPGKPKYLGGDSSESTTSNLIEAANGNFASLQEMLSNRNKSEYLRYYDFESDYIGYIKYVNILCRAAATFLEIDPSFTIDGTPLQSYDWKNYRWNSENYMSLLGSAGSHISKSLKTNNKNMKYSTDSSSNDASLESIQTANFVQFYVDPESSGVNEGYSNTTGQSKLAGALDTGSETMKELAFLTNSGGISQSKLMEFANESANSFAESMTAVLTSGSMSGIASSLGRILGAASYTLRGENLIMPDIYQDSSVSKSYQMTVHLKAPYGTKVCYYMEVIVPLMFLLALSIPKQTTANSYSSPFLIKAYIEGVFACNLGIISQININKSVSSDSWTVDGLPNEIDVTLDITDLYSDLTMSPSNEPLLFCNNSSLVEYIAVMCGISLITPQLKMKIDLTIDSVISSITDIPTNVVSNITQSLENVISGFFYINK